MSFAIEVPGEANPLTEGLLVHSLKSAASRDPYQIQTGTKQLQQWERSQGYYVHLQNAYLDQSLPIEVRYLAIIQLKNGIDKYWRKTAINAVTKDDKSIIRSRLLDSALQEHDSRLALQDALVIAKITRFEYSSDWPDIVTSLLDVLRRASDPLPTSRALLILLHLTKELSTGRLQRTRQNLQAVAPELVRVVGSLYAARVGSWRGEIQEGFTQNLEDDLRQSLLAIKTIRRLLIAGYEHPNRDSDVLAFWSLSIGHLASMMQLQKGLELPPEYSWLPDVIEKHMLQLGKLHHEMIREHPAAFALLPNSLELVNAYWSVIKASGASFSTKNVVASAIATSIGTDGDVVEGNPTMEKLVIRGLLIVRACVKMVHNPAHIFKTRHPADKEEWQQATERLRRELLTDIFIQEIMETVITHFFVFRASDLREWEEEPEEWEKREEGGDSDDWEFSIRPCSEKLFLDVAINYKGMLMEPLLRVFHTVATPQNEDVLFKDSVYTAVGLAAAVLYEYLDFDAFIRNVLVVEVQKAKPGFNIIRRRAAILLGQWISVKVSSESRPLVYQIFQHLLTPSPQNDQVVRVTASRQLSAVANDWEFNADQFMPYAASILTNIMQLIEEVELSETKMALLNTISVVVQRLEQSISPFAERIVSLLPGLWQQSGDEHLMKQAILTLLARLITSLKGESVPYHTLLLPIIQGAVAPGSDTQVYLLEDALDLWHNIVVQTPTGASASSDLLGLTQYLNGIFELGSDSLRKALEIAESYTLLAPEHMLLDSVRKPIFSSLASLLGTLRAEANGVVCNLVEVMVRKAEQLGGESGVAQIAADLVECGFFGRLLGGLRGSWKAHCTTGPLAKEPLVDGIIETDYFAIFARTIVGSVNGFCRAVQAAATNADVEKGNLEVVMEWLLEEWFSHLENVGDPGRKKLMALALTKLLETNQSWIFLNLQSLMTIWTDLVTELREDAETGDSLVYDNGADTLADAAETSEDARRRAMTYSDPVHTINLPAWIKHHLQQAVAGSPGFQQDWLVNVDQDVVKAFRGLGIV